MMSCWTQCTARAVPLAEAAVDPTVLRQTSLILPCSPRSGFSALRPSRSILGLCPVGEAPTMATMKVSKKASHVQAGVKASSRPPTVTISTCDQPKAAAATTITSSRPAMA